MCKQCVQYQQFCWLDVISSHWLFYSFHQIAYHFQENLLRTMIQIENTYFELGKSCSKNCLIICDRGVMDASACKYDGNVMKFERTMLSQTKHKKSWLTFTGWYNWHGDFGTFSDKWSSKWIVSKTTLSINQNSVQSARMCHISLLIEIDCWFSFGDNFFSF